MATAILLCLAAWTPACAAAGELLFSDDFETGASGWIVSDPDDVTLVESGDPARGRVLQLEPAGSLVSALINRLRLLPPGEPVFALIGGSEQWGPYRIEGEVYFPDDGDSYLGFMYHYRRRAGRTDFGSVYVIDKPDERYVRLNPHYDWNPARGLFEEFRVALEKPAERDWLPFAAEVVGSSLHFYVGDLETPVATAAPFEGDSGLAGLSPRVVGAPVWVDSIRVRAIERHRYRGPPRPAAVRPPRPEVLTEWEALGPFAAPQQAVERDPVNRDWAAFRVDARGAVVSAKLTEHLSDRRFAYFRTELTAAEDSVLELASSVRIAAWVDGRRAELGGPGIGRFDFRRVAWLDFREGAQASLAIPSGRHALLLRVESDYSGVGFFARLRPRP